MKNNIPYSSDSSVDYYSSFFVQFQCLLGATRQNPSPGNRESQRTLRGLKANPPLRWIHFSGGSGRNVRSPKDSRRHRGFLVPISYRRQIKGSMLFLWQPLWLGTLRAPMMFSPFPRRMNSHQPAASSLLTAAPGLIGVIIAILISKTQLKTFQLLPFFRWLGLDVNFFCDLKNASCFNYNPK